MLPAYAVRMVKAGNMPALRPVGVPCWHETSVLGINSSLKDFAFERRAQLHTGRMKAASAIHLALELVVSAAFFCSLGYQATAAQSDCIPLAGGGGSNWTAGMLASRSSGSSGRCLTRSGCRARCRSRASATRCRSIPNGW